MIVIFLMIYSEIENKSKLNSSKNNKWDYVGYFEVCKKSLFCM